MDERYYVGVMVQKRGDRAALRDAAFRRAVELAPFEPPEEAVQEEHALLLAEFKHRMTYDSMVTGKPLYLYENLSEQMENLKDEAVFHVKAQLVLKDVIDREGFTVSAQELETEGDALARRQGVTPEKVREFFGPDLSMLRSDLLEQKVLDFICEHAILSNN